MTAGQRDSGTQIDLLAVGDVMLDVFVPVARAGARTHGSVRVRAGGSAVNAALAAVRGGARAAVAGRVGDDAAGRFVTKELEAAGVEALLAVDADEPTGSVAIVGDTVVASRGANACFGVEDVPELATRATLVSGYLLLHADSSPGAAAALERPGLIGVDLASAALLRTAPDARALVAPADVVLGGEDTFGALTGAGADDGLRDLARGRTLACATLGARGARACSSGELVRVRPRETVDGDLVGAGDAFAAVLLLALADGLEPVDALARACEAGAAV